LRLLDSAKHRAVLFDLDGTLVDTAPDMVAVLQVLQLDHDLPPVTYDVARSYVSDGVIGLLRLGFPGADDDLREKLQLEYLSAYAKRICERSTVFGGLEPLLRQLEDASIPWGVVTNKPQRLTEPLLAALQLADRIACCVSGDTLTLRKPDPAPLLHACELVGINVHECVYVGDSPRDIEAGRAAGMSTIAAAYGYVKPDDNAEDWGADSIAADTKELAQIVLKAVNLVT
jgi:phosphoglycolate phosphatase